MSRNSGAGGLSRGVGFSVGNPRRVSPRSRFLLPLESRRAFLECASPVAVPPEFTGGVEFLRCCGVCPSCLRWIRLSTKESQRRLERIARKALEPEAPSWSERMASLPPERSEEDMRSSDWPNGRPSEALEKPTSVLPVEVLAARILEYARRSPDLRPCVEVEPLPVADRLASLFHPDPVLSEANHESLALIEGYRFNTALRRAVQRARKRDQRARREGGGDPHRIMESLPDRVLPLPDDEPQGSLL